MSAIAWLRQLLTCGRTICPANMLILKSLAVWLLERLVEVFLLGVLLGYLALPNFTGLFSGVWILGVAVGVILFMHGYYLTTAFFGVVWRSTTSWVYPTITAALFAIHSRIVFVRLKSDFSPEGRAMESPFVLCGVCIVFACAFAGNRILNKWVQASANSNAYLSATGITLLLFLLANVAHFLRPAAYDNSFRPYGLPLHFYREGGFVDGWVWHSGGFIWHGIFADAALAVAIVVLLGKAWHRINSARAQ